jgi:tetratricopeptide (TPR) repeat protein
LRNIAAALAKIGPTAGPLSSGDKAMTPETPETDVERRGPPVFTSRTIRENRKWGTLYSRAMPRHGKGGHGGRRPRLGGGAATWASSLLVVILSVGVRPLRAAAASPSFWERVAEASRTRPDRLVAEAEALLASQPRSADKLARAEVLVREALAVAPDDFGALVVLAEVSERAARPAVALAALERACPVAPRGPATTGCWSHLGVTRARLGHFAEGLVAYERLIATGEADALTYANAGEVLMAEGHLGEAEERYREAIRLETAASAAGRIETSHALVLATYGLAVVLDRAGRPDAAREMMARALLLDGRHATLTAAEQPDADVFFVPDGDVYYYLGLAADVAGDADEGAAAFQEFLRRRPRDASAARARAHLEALAARARAPRAAARPATAALRVVAAGTVAADGPVPAPLVDAAWRGRPDLLDACLTDAVGAGLLAPREGFRLAFELAIDARGVVTEATVKSPPSLDASFARCAEAALRGGLRVAPPRRARVTRVRLELLVALANPDTNGV